MDDETPGIETLENDYVFSEKIIEIINAIALPKEKEVIKQR